MDELTRVLWEYASSYRLEAFYGREGQEGREECTCAMEQNRAELKELSPPDLWKRVSALYDCAEELRLRDMEAPFACGFRLGASLR